MLTLDLNRPVGSTFPVGWTTVTIDNAVEGEYNGTRYIDLFFKDQPETLKCRVWSAVNAKTSEEFAIANLFHHAWAGITVDEATNTATIDDNVRHLIGRVINVLFYLNDDGFTDAVGRVAPVVSQHFTEADVSKLKSSTERYHAGRNKTSTGLNGTADTITETADVPF